MLQIKRSSWHWKLNHYVWGERVDDTYTMWGGEPQSMSHSLCPYFWGLILAIIGVPFVAFYRKVGGSIILGSILSGVAVMFIIALYFIFTKVGATIFIVGSLAFFGFAVLLSISVSEPSEREYKHKEKKKKEPSMTWQMMKGIKNRYCPMIQVVD